LDFKKRQATKQAEEKFSQYFRQVFAELLKETKVKIIKGEEKVSSPDRTKGESTMGHININH